MFELTVSLFCVALCVFVTFFMVLYMLKLWKIKSGLEKFLLHLTHLDKQLQSIGSTSRHGKEKRVQEQKDKRICENCENTRIYISPEVENMFIYHCIIHNREVGQNDTCASFKVDLLKWQLD